MRILEPLLTHPLTRGLDVDDPETTLRRREIIRDKAFLHRVYAEWYAAIADALSQCEGKVLELGSGAGFLKEFVPGVVTSEILRCRGVDAVLDAQTLPFRDGAFGAIAMVDVLHHLSHPGHFFAEAARCVSGGGLLVMIEPWVTRWSAFVYGRLHNEPFAPNAEDWESPAQGPLAGANSALPWIVFHRDRVRFEMEFPAWEVLSIRPFMPFCYLLSGGVSNRGFMPGWSYPMWRGFEKALERWAGSLPMFAVVVLRRRSGGAGS